jgi:predicted AlkP superfamily phosphohydrolase/phosphomutase
VRRVKHHLPEERIGELEKRYWRRPDWWEMRLRDPAPPQSRDLLAEAARRELDDMVATSWYRPSWSRMPYFVVPSFSDCHIRLNLRGRERDGFIDPDRYEEACEEVERQVRSILDARTGRSIVDEVIRTRAKDPMGEIGPVPDLVVTFRGEVTDVVRHPDVGVVGPVPLMQMGEHTVDGWASITVPGAGPGNHGRIELRDLTATVLGLLGVAPSPSVTGRDVRADG